MQQPAIGVEVGNKQKKSSTLFIFKSTITHTQLFPVKQQMPFFIFYNYWQRSKETFRCTLALLHVYWPFLCLFFFSVLLIADPCFVLEKAFVDVLVASTSGQDITVLLPPLQMQRPLVWSSSRGSTCVGRRTSGLTFEIKATMALPL